MDAILFIDVHFFFGRKLRHSETLMAETVQIEYHLYCKQNIEIENGAFMAAQNTRSPQVYTHSSDVLWLTWSISWYLSLMMFGISGRVPVRIYLGSLLIFVHIWSPNFSCNVTCPMSLLRKFCSSLIRCRPLRVVVFHCVRTVSGLVLYSLGIDLNLRRQIFLLFDLWQLCLQMYKNISSSVREIFQNSNYSF